MIESDAVKPLKHLTDEDVLRHLESMMLQAHYFAFQVTDLDVTTKDILDRQRINACLIYAKLCAEWRALRRGKRGNSETKEAKP